ncbi:LysR family transcriptional regulator [Clostridium ljungdahlii]|uniref:HTH-type transcriptional regulator CynR n=1 Tax=Clostridium ljungdahlii TaxID=1538 RepID=A0A166RMJ7_9CLOT|nr:LysR substrate-binding domain-containing protein [Clostridium ljungdahlii]OAA90948.1 HTH-type transcriptional regulator CynR [Clostridium ljungdahlii]
MKNIAIQDLSDFLQVCEDKSITKASKSLFISPQGLSKAIKRLENKLGVKLFLRKSSGMELTSYGIVVKESCKKILDEFEKMNINIEKILNINREKIKLVSAYGILRLLTPNCVLNFKNKNQYIDFEYEEFPDIYVDENVENGKADLGFTIEPIDNTKFNKIPLKSYRLCLLVNKRHNLSKKKEISFEDLKDVNMVIESKKFKLNSIIRAKCNNFGFEPKIIFETSGFSLCHKLCHQNKCVSVTTDFISKDMKHHDLVVIPFQDQSCKWSSCIILKKGGYVSDATKKFIDFVVYWSENVIK